jgi:hypothetical protein
LHANFTKKLAGTTTWSMPKKMRKPKESKIGNPSAIRSRLSLTPTLKQSSAKCTWRSERDDKQKLFNTPNLKKLALIRLYGEKYDARKIKQTLELHQ